MTDPADSHIAAKLQAASAELAKGHLPDAANRDLIVRAIKMFIAQPSRARDELLRREGQRDRDEWLRRLAREHCGAITSRRARARQVLTWATRYQETGWRLDAHSFGCPEHLVGTPQEYAWRALSALLRVSRKSLDALSGQD